jgi:sugar phosphate isomerase/epimerase
VCAALARAGYTGVELAPFTFAPNVGAWSRDERRLARQIAADAGLTIVGLHWLLARTEGLHLTSADRATRGRTARYVIDLAEACQDVGGTVMVFGSPHQRSLVPGTSVREAMEWAAEVFRAVMPPVADCGVTVCMEPLSAEETNFVNSCAEAMELIQRVDHPRFQLQLDVKAMASEPAPVPDLVRQYAPRAGHFHANDPNRRGPGFGSEDFAPIFAALTETRYTGWVSVEAFDYTPDPETIAIRSLEYMTRCQADTESRR